MFKEHCMPFHLLRFNWFSFPFITEFTFLFFFFLDIFDSCDLGSYKGVFLALLEILKTCCRMQDNVILYNTHKYKIGLILVPN